MFTAIFLALYIDIENERLWCNLFWLEEITFYFAFLYHKSDFAIFT